MSEFSHRCVTLEEESREDEEEEVELSKVKKVATDLCKSTW